MATGDVPQGRVRSMLPVFEPSSSGNPSAEVQSSTLQHRFKPCTQGSAEVPPVAIQVAPQGRKQSTTCGRQGGLCSPLFSPTAAGALSMHSTAWCLVAPPPATFDESAPPLTSRDNRRKKQHRRRAQAKRDAYRACYSKAASADIHRACMSDLDIPQSFSNLPRQLTCPPGASGGFPSDSDTNSPPLHAAPLPATPQPGGAPGERESFEHPRTLAPDPNQLACLETKTCMHRSSFFSSLDGSALPCMHEYDAERAQEAQAAQQASFRPGQGFAGEETCFDSAGYVAQHAQQLVWRNLSPIRTRCRPRTAFSLSSMPSMHGVQDPGYCSMGHSSLLSPAVRAVQSRASEAHSMWISRHEGSGKVTGERGGRGVRSTAAEAAQQRMRPPPDSAFSMHSDGAGSVHIRKRRVLGGCL